MRRLKYIGDGAFFPGVPAEDHECEDEAQAARLAASGLYAYADKGKPDKGVQSASASAEEASDDAQSAEGGEGGKG